MVVSKRSCLVVRQLRLWVNCFCIAESLTNYGRFSLIVKAYNGQCLARLLTLYLVGKKLGRELKTGATGEPYQLVYGGPSGRK
ncbi:hypothetical protein MTR67_007569 [Solanum verrucosum]|uniref:Uncharacterized protein n=1 Tax=Solanum verrucosum TaxID=315347 RepID=A0AAF0TD79_SOLVR|nr:hypothetical protein MTR67_007569 [Solanum verrucosum]